MKLMLEEAKRHDGQAIAVVGTAWKRIARNAEEVVEAIRHGTGIEIEVISGEEEGRLAYLAVQAGLGLGDGFLVVFDQAAEAPSSPSVEVLRSPNASASRSVRSVSPSASDSMEWWRPRSSTRPSLPYPTICPGSTAAQHRIIW